MTTIKHPITKDAAGNGFTYRGMHVRIHPKHPDKNYRYLHWLGNHSLKAATKAGICAEIDLYIKQREKGWTPVRKGLLYCSPLCGAGCKHAEFLAAKKRAADLCNLLGEGWTPRVWENFGWHASAQNGVAEMHTPNPKRECDSDGHYGLYFNTIQQIVLHGPDPAALVAAAVDAAGQNAQAMMRDILAITPRPKKAANDSTKPHRKAA